MNPMEENPLSDLGPQEINIRERFEAIIYAKEQEFPFHWNDEPAIPDY